MESITENMSESMQTAAADAADERKERMVVIDFKMVTFSLAGKDYAIDIMKVKEIAKAGRFTYVPNTSPFVLGVYNLRGDIIPVIDLRCFFNIEVPERKPDDLENMIIVSVEEQTFGIVVDVIDKVVGIQSSTIQPPHPLFGDISIKYIAGVVESNNRLYILLDIDRIFASRTYGQTEDTVEKKLSVVHSEKTAEILPEHEKTAARAASAPVRQAAPQESAEKETDIDYTFIVDSLKNLKKFYVSDVNEEWVKSRFNEWVKTKPASALQLTNDDEASEFLSSFYSPANGTFWSDAYADSIYKMLPDNTAKQITVWNPGCGKGYEAFSLACLLKKRYSDSRIRIYAHDIDLLCVSNAPLLTVPAQFASGWYAPFLTKTVSGEYTFSPEIKDMVLFEYHDCLNTNSMPNVDVIFCRDLLSFMPKEPLDTVLSDFEDRLKGNGILLIGEHEALGGRVNWTEKTVGSITVYGK